MKFYYHLWEVVIVWVGNNVMYISEPISINSEGLFGYIRVVTRLIITAIASIILALADRKRDKYNRLFYWLTVYVRYFLASVIIGYGLSKFPYLRTQFGNFPFKLDDLVQPYGQFSPMGVLWRFMNYSPGYQFFTGIAEVLGALLLFFRRTTTLGSIILIVVLSNVVMLNINYDVPVKLHAAHLLLMAIFLLAPDIDRIIRFFFLNKPVPSIQITPPFVKQWMKTAKVIVKLLLITFIVYFQITQLRYYYKLWIDVPRPSLYGIYNIESFVKNKDTLPPLTTDTLRWRRLIISWKDEATIQLMNDSLRYFTFKQDTVHKTIEMFPKADSAHKYLQSYTVNGADFFMRGKLKEDSVYISMKKMDINTFRLVNWRWSWLKKRKNRY